ncbi:hypothetical protein [Spirosoma linguale]|uniref:hypothetical protein n=1 Tax=Spirosoma linguale TaxID=108 RepID=UPI0001A3CA16
MNWKNLFSFPKRKKTRRKVIEHLSQSDGPIDASQVTGGTPTTPGQPDVGWLKNGISDIPKP